MLYNESVVKPTILLRGRFKYEPRTVIDCNEKYEFAARLEVLHGKMVSICCKNNPLRHREGQTINVSSG